MLLKSQQTMRHSQLKPFRLERNSKVFSGTPAMLATALAFSFLLPTPGYAQDSKTTGEVQAETAEMKLTSGNSTEEKAQQALSEIDAKSIAAAAPATNSLISVSKASVLVGSFTVFLLAVFVGFEIIAKVPPTLHTPLMSGSNAISGITVVGAMLTAGSAVGGFGSLLGMLAVVLAMINVVGGFLVTHRMLMMFKKR